MYSFDIIIVGGGLAGLTAAIHLKMHGYHVAVFEPKQYPHHKVCGEYVSNEVLPYMAFLGISLPKTYQINQMLFSTTTGSMVKANLPMGGFGLSRYAFDEVLYKRAIALGVLVIHENVSSIWFDQDSFRVSAQLGGKYSSKFVIGAYGKRGALDRELQRNFTFKKSPWLGVKAHYKLDSFPANLVAVHNFRGGYGGLSKTESGVVNLCYLVSYDSFKKEKNVDSFNQNVLAQNPYLNEFLNDAEMLFDQPLAIGQISFHKKKPVENHMLMCGDTAGLIHPLCGNGMAMAIHSAKIASESIHNYYRINALDRRQMEKDYEGQWRHMFTRRLLMGRLLQSALLNQKISNIAMRILAKSPHMLHMLIRNTHGRKIMGQ